MAAWPCVRGLQHPSRQVHARARLTRALSWTSVQALRVASSASSASLDGIFELLRAQMDVFAPVVLYDHVAAVGAWALLYVIEVIVIVSVLNKYPDDAQKAVRVPVPACSVAVFACARLLFPTPGGGLQRHLAQAHPTVAADAPHLAGCVRR